MLCEHVTVCVYIKGNHVCVRMSVCVCAYVSMYDCQREYPRIHACTMPLPTPRNIAHLCRLQDVFCYTDIISWLYIRYPPPSPR